MDTDEIAIIKQNGTRFINLKNDIIVPKHDRAIKTIILKRLAIDLDLSKWLASIADCLLYQDMFVSISFRLGSLRMFFKMIQFWLTLKSFLAKNQSNQLVYMNGSNHYLRTRCRSWKNLESYAAKALANHFKIATKSDFDDLISRYSNYSDSDHLENSFIKSQKDNVFYLSGFRPYRLVASYIWIEK